MFVYKTTLDGMYMHRSAIILKLLTGVVKIQDADYLFTLAPVKKRDILSSKWTLSSQS